MPTDPRLWLSKRVAPDRYIPSCSKEPRGLFWSDRPVGMSIRAGLRCAVRLRAASATTRRIGVAVKSQSIPSVCRSFTSSPSRVSPSDPQRGDYLPEDPTPATWQRVTQLAAGTIATGTLIYFVLFADFGDGEHCFMPVRFPTYSDSSRIKH